MRLAWVELALGLVVASAGALHTVWALPAELSELRPSAHHGVLLLGVMLMVKAIAELASSVQWVGEVTPAEASGAWARFREAVAGPRAEALVGVLLIIAGGVEATTVAEAAWDGVYQWGVVVAGVAMLCRTGFGLVEGFEKLSSTRLRGLAHVVARWFHRPAVQLALALGFVSLGLIEWLSPPAVPAEGAGEAGAPTAPHGLAAFGLLGMLRGAADLGRGARLGWGLATALSVAGDEQGPVGAAGIPSAGLATAPTRGVLHPPAEAE